jgi:hypothetical protein
MQQQPRSIDELLEIAEEAVENGPPGLRAQVFATIALSRILLLFYAQMPKKE